MPNRLIRESCRTSPTLAMISGDAERLFWRLTTVADDYGRFDGRPEVIRAECFQTMLDTVTTAKVGKWVEALTQMGLTMTYLADGRPYLAIAKWDKYQDTRAKRSKWPDPPLASANTCEHVPADVPVSVSVSVSESVVGLARERAPIPPRKLPIPWPENFKLTDKLKAFAEAGGLDPEMEWGHFKDHHRSKNSRFVDWEAAYRVWCRNSVKFEASRRRD